jgi:hypothetical protein
MEAENRLLQEIAEERQRQEEKWGTRVFESPADGGVREWWYTVLGEEFGEVGRAILEGK